MPRPASKHPTELELQILKVLWRSGPSAVKHVRQALAGIRDLSYSSVTTMLNIMVEKGYLQRHKEGVSFIYEALVDEADTTGRMLDDVVDRAFDGSASAVMLRLLENASLDEPELKKIRAFLNRQKKRRPR